MSKQYRYFVADFETTVYDGQIATEVWACGIVELQTENVIVLHSIEETLNYFVNLNENVVVYFHNLKFDGSFWIDYFLRIETEQAYNGSFDKPYEIRFLKDKDMRNNTFKYVISDKGQWYTITYKTKYGKIIEIRDSLKLLPFSVEEIGKGFSTKHRKLTMEYKGFRYAGCEITPEEEEYIKNDVLVVKEALEEMFTEGHNRLTIGSCCLAEYKNMIGSYDWRILFPDLTEITIDVDKYGSSSVDEYIRKSYRGGWCYVVPEKANKIYYNGLTADVNSLYPSRMHSESGCEYPIGKPLFWSGDYIPEKAKKQYFFVRIKTRFYLKKDMLPFIQIKGSRLYKGTENLTTSDIKYRGKYYSEYTDEFGVHDTRVTLTLTMTDYYRLLEHYVLVDFEILDGCWFYKEKGIFDEYINKYAKQKQESVGAKRTESKLFLNNLYGKLSASTDSSFKVAFLDNGNVRFASIPANEKKSVHIACGSAITSYSRDFTIRTAQKNYHGVDEKGFIYADTDSIHCDIADESELIDVPIDDKKFNHWKIESHWDKAIFVRQKTYIEHIEADKPFYDVKCAGMSKRCKELLISTFEDSGLIVEPKNKDEEVFISCERTLTDFKIGLTVPSKLSPKRIKGGILLTDTTYQMH